MPERTGVTVECDRCEEEFDPAAAGGWCTNPDCGEWQYEGRGSDAPAEGEAEREESGDEDRSEARVTELERETTEVESGEPDPPVECPGCGVDVSPGDNFCASCGQDLESARNGDLLTACPGCGADVGAGDSFCASCGENLETHRTARGAGGPVPENLVLATRGEELAVGDGDTLGRELRRIIIETGGDEEQAVRIHREHVQFDRENGQFYVVDLGTNPTRVNGQPLKKGDRKPVTPGDEIELSGVVGMVIREP